jgi:hypothetical protein
MTLERMADGAVTAIEVHGALDLERSRVCRVARDTDKDKPLLVRGSAIIYNLSASKRCMMVKDLRRR